MKKTPKVGLILDYYNVFEKAMPDDRIAFLSKRGITKNEVLSRLCLINFMLSPTVSARFDYSQGMQHSILDKMLTIDNANPAIGILKRKIDENTIVFNRATNLFAMMEIINSDLPAGGKDTPVNNMQELDFFGYYLCVNHETNKIGSDYDSEKPDLERLNVSFLAHNEYFQDIDPIQTVYRGKKLFDWIESDPKYKEAFTGYILEVSGKSVSKYLVEILSIFFAKGSSKDEFNFYFKLDKDVSIFNSFSKRTLPIEFGNQLEALDIRKSPIYRLDEDSYMLLDNKFLLEKCYSLIIWDFLFEKLVKGKDDKERKKIIIEYRSSIGYFFESYVREKVENSLPHLKHPKPKLFDDLKISGKEIGDIYIRQNKKIILGEVKSSGIPSKSKYSDTLDDLYANDHDKFFKIHGLEQLITNLNNLLSNPSEYDDKLDLSKKNTIYPIIVTNEISLTLGFTIHVFNKEFNSRFDRSKHEGQVIKPVMILHISDLEFLEQYLRDKTLVIFDVLSDHFKKFDIIPKLSMSYAHLPPRHPQNVGELIFGDQYK